MEQQRTLNALQSFVAISKAANSPRTAADLVTQATSHPDTYVFAELLQTPNIQALRQSPEYASHLKLLEIFAWGTYADYKATPNLSSLTPAQEHKLRLLSLLPLLTTPPTPTSTTPPASTQLSYTHLQQALSLPNTRALEALLTTALSSGLIIGHLDPLHQLVAVISVAPLRDLAPASVPTLISTLDDWESRCDNTLSEIEGRVQAIRDNAHVRGQVEARRKATFEGEVDKGEDDKGRGLRSGNSKRAAPMGEMGVADGDAMDVDEVLGDGGAPWKSGLTRGSKKHSSRGSRRDQKGL